MSAESYTYLYGPVPSRRLGRSLGVDLVPFKTCTYDCVYCQLGRTTNKTLDRKEYISGDMILSELKRKLADRDRPDYITLAGSGEPTLNSGIGNIIRGIKGRTDIPVAVLTNGSLLWLDAVQDALMAADLVIPSLDAGDNVLYQYVNRPHGGISFEQLAYGLAAFTKRFPGEVWLEVLLLAGVTGLSVEANKIAAIANRLGVARIQLNTAAWPPAEEFAIALSSEQLLVLKGLFHGQVDVISENIREVTEDAAPGHASDADILALLNRRPCTVEGIANGLALHPNHVLKRVLSLRQRHAVKAVRKDNTLFYESCRNEEEN
jgi:wyosine [tRNA(Phe)-imidazoG37] synthetase (radical SAM superfamily)